MATRTATTRAKRVKTESAAEQTIGRYIEGVGRRKTAIARVRIRPDDKSDVVVNGKTLETYFPTDRLRQTAQEAFVKAKLPETFSASVRVSGGGVYAQAEAVRHGAARALVRYNDDVELRKRLKRVGFLKRDPRVKERRKFGLKKARRAPQWSKR